MCDSLSSRGRNKYVDEWVGLSLQIPTQSVIHLIIPVNGRIVVGGEALFLRNIALSSRARAYRSGFVPVQRTVSTRKS